VKGVPEITCIFQEGRTMSKYKPGHSGNPAGKPRGCRNKIPKTLKERVLRAIEELEKENKSLTDEARKDPRWFYENFFRPMLPKELNFGNADEKPLRIVVNMIREVEDV
jgi:hypothetical protein